MSVKAAALGNGFWHLGDFSRGYRLAFGETPSRDAGAGQTSLSATHFRPLKGRRSRSAVAGPLRWPLSLRRSTQAMPIAEMMKVRWISTCHITPLSVKLLRVVPRLPASMKVLSSESRRCR